MSGKSLLFTVLVFCIQSTAFGVNSPEVTACIKKLKKARETVGIAKHSSRPSLPILRPNQHLTPVNMAFGDDTQMILNIMKGAAIQTVITDGVKKSIDGVVSVAVSGAATNAATATGDLLADDEPSIGGEVVGAYGIIKSGIDFAHAKNDKQRAFAAANAAAGVLTIIVPPAGAIADSCLFAAEVSDAVLDAQAGAQLADIQTQINENYKLITESKQRIADGESALLSTYNQFLWHLNEQMNLYAPKTTDSCDQATCTNDIEEMQSCLNNMNEVISLQESVAMTIESMSNMNISTPELESYLADHNASPQACVDRAKQVQAKVDIARNNLTAVTKRVHEKATKYILDQIRQKHGLTDTTYAMFNCSTKFDEYLVDVESLKEVYQKFSSEKPQLLLPNLYKKLGTEGLVQMGNDILQGCQDVQLSDTTNDSTKTPSAAGYEFFFEGLQQFKQARAEFLQMISPTTMLQ